jgi:hypothetical protein
MNRIDAVKSVSFCAAAGAEAARRWLLCPSASMADYRDSALAELLAVCRQPQHEAQRRREFCDGFAARIAREIAHRSSDAHYRASKALQLPARAARGRAHRRPVVSHVAPLITASPRAEA